MTQLTRFLLPAAIAALAAGAAGCQSATSQAAGTGLSSAAPSVPAPAATRAPVSSMPAAGRVVYLAEGGSVNGTVVHVPACKQDCALSGDSTTFLRDMTWSAWNTTMAAGSGTEVLDDCAPNCAEGTLHAVPARVTLSKPVMVCVAGTGRWFWTRVSFTWPSGLPAAFSGDNAPSNPFDYPGITAQAAKSCP